MQTAKRADAKGRVILGAAYANKMLLIVEKKDGDLLIKKAKVIPEKESWLYKNKAAFASVMRGIEQAKRGEFVSDPMKDEHKRSAKNKSMRGFLKEMDTDVLREKDRKKNKNVKTKPKSKKSH